MMSDRPALETSRLGKRFSGLVAVDDLNLSVREGDIYGYLGPNGAGKTTSIRMMLGLIKPSSGKVAIFGRSLRRDFKAAIGQVGAMVEGPAFYPYLSGIENLKLFGRLSGGVSRPRLEEALGLVGLSRRGKHKVKVYSQGMRQRLGIAQALLHHPRLLILDEPTNGLDPQGMREVRNLIRRIRDEEGVTVFLSSHLLGEMEMVCDRIGIIHRGRVIGEGRMDDLIGSDSDVVSLQVDPEQDQDCRRFLQDRFGTEAQVVRRGWLEFPKQEIDTYQVNRSALAAGLRVASISTRHRTLEEFFVGLTGESQDVF